MGSCIGVEQMKAKERIGQYPLLLSEGFRWYPVVEGPGQRANERNGCRHYERVIAD